MDKVGKEEERGVPIKFVFHDSVESLMTTAYLHHSPNTVDVIVERCEISVEYQLRTLESYLQKDDIW